LEQKDFLKLLVAKMTQQDPLNPEGDEEFISQMASFASLEQSRAMLEDIQLLRADQATLKANALLGRHVVLNLENGNTLSGPVTGVLLNASGPRVLVGGQAYALDQIASISAEAPTANPETPTPKKTAPNPIPTRPEHSGSSIAILPEAGKPTGLLDGMLQNLQQLKHLNALPMAAASPNL
jgi:flagellar basal-body rod modification protein FlgD